MLRLEQDWMVYGSCRAHPELGWIKDPADVGIGENATMCVICAGCPVHRECTGLVARENITSGFWAGEHRDLDPAAGYGGAA